VLKGKEAKAFFEKVKNFKISGTPEDKLSLTCSLDKYCEKVYAIIPD
jgi:hypothetical protein